MNPLPLVGIKREEDMGGYMGRSPPTVGAVALLCYKQLYYTLTKDYHSLGALPIIILYYRCKLYIHLLNFKSKYSSCSYVVVTVIYIRRTHAIY